eukprot:gene8593-11611_t
MNLKTKYWIINAFALLLNSICSNGFRVHYSSALIGDKSLHSSMARSYCTSNYYSCTNNLYLFKGLSRLYASTGGATQPELWYKSTITSKEKLCESLVKLQVRVDPLVSQQYISPGQYVKLKLGDAKPSFYAIASPPDSSSDIFTLIIKDAPNNELILNAPIDQSVLDISIPMGKGYQIEEYFDKYKNDFPTTNILLLACGSGIAPIAAAIESNLLGLKTTKYNSLFARKAKLYIGAKTPAHLPLTEKYQEWEELGVTVIPVISRVDDPKSLGWKGKTGYIQDVLREDEVSVPKNTAALLCGMRGMTDNAKELLLESGVFEGRILFNF